ncbi:glycosyltransferase [Cerasicoccus fimbriatus]|uniref:glycosyltransferase n=1 Tax=Cerasicoccus fimbriatus TaxID=3014554 RepID=UPI0022B2B3C0|nr:glycosyltransferase [Cerasicoccus sp. TK19100]
MKIAQYSTFSSGGAGIAATRIHHGLRALGVENQFGSLDGPEAPRDGCFRIPKRYTRWYEQIAWRAGIALNESMKRQQDRQRLDTGHAAFSWPRSDYDINALPQSQQADAIHLHWVSDLLDWPTFFQSTDKKVFWTLHDMHPFMGGFHYDCDREQASHAVKAEDEKLAAIKAESIKAMPTDRLVIVTPSQWLSNESKASAMLGRFEHITINNGIDTNTFKPYPQTFARDVFGLPQNAKLLLTVAEQLGNYRKGSDILAEALKRISPKQDLAVISAGSGTFSVDGIPSYSVGSVSDERLMALLYSAADLLVLPTRGDNFPNVIIEALATGTPVAATSIGGVPEAVLDGFNGMLAKDLTPSGLATAIESALQADFDLQAIREDAVKRFDVSVASARYKALYEKTLHA